MAVSASVRRAIFERDGHCLHCGVTEGLTIQHRANRGAGGSKLRDTPSNLIALCGLSNQLLECDALRARAGRDHGWKLRSWEYPLTVPVLDVLTGEWAYIDNDYNRVLTQKRDAA